MRPVTALYVQSLRYVLAIVHQCPQLQEFRRAIRSSVPLCVGMHATLADQLVSQSIGCR